MYCIKTWHVWISVGITSTNDDENTETDSSELRATYFKKKKFHGFIKQNKNVKKKKKIICMRSYLKRIASINVMYNF